MKVIILGSGVIGVSTAYYLAKAGHQVTVVDRQNGAALETSFANAGQVSPGYSAPWAAPGIPIKAMKWLVQRHAPLAIRPDGSLYQWRWIAAMLRNCTPGRYAVNKERMVRLAEYSRDCLKTLRQETGISYEGRTLGTLQVFRTEAQLDAAVKDIAVLEQCGVPYELLDRDGCVRAEPALALVQHRLVGGLAELAGFDLRLNPRRRETLEMVVGELFPHGGDIPAASFWAGLRPMTPDGTPIVGGTSCANLWLNTGHGTLGWTMACGSGQLLADLIARRRPAIRPEGLGYERYGRHVASAPTLAGSPRPALR